MLTNQSFESIMAPHLEKIHDEYGKLIPDCVLAAMTAAYRLGLTSGTEDMKRVIIGIMQEERWILYRLNQSRLSRFLNPMR